MSGIRTKDVAVTMTIGLAKVRMVATTSRGFAREKGHKFRRSNRTEYRAERFVLAGKEGHVAASCTSYGVANTEKRI